MGLALGWRLFDGGARERNPGRRLWGASYGAAALAAGVGAVRHGWGPVLAPGVEQALWWTTAVAIPAAGALLLAGAAVAHSGGALRRALLLLCGLRVAGLGAWTLVRREYLALGIDAALGTALVLALLARAARRGAFGGLRPVAAGVAVGLGGAALRQLAFAPHPHFNENDVFHLLQVVSLWLIYRGGRELGGTAAVVASRP